MNGIYFLLPFLAILAVGLADDYYADAQVQSVTVHGERHSITTHPDGSKTFVSHDPYVQDQNGDWVPFIQNGNMNSTAVDSVTIALDGKFNFGKGIRDDIVLKYTDDNWATVTYPDSLNDKIPDVSNAQGIMKSSKLFPTVGLLEYKYIDDDGKWKTQLEFTKMGGAPGLFYGFDQQVDIDRDVVEIADITIDIDADDGRVFDRQFIDNNDVKIIDFMNGILFDFDIGIDDLNSISVHDTGAGTSRLIFDYRTYDTLANNETLIIDPSFSGNASADGRLQSQTGGGTTCPAYDSVGTTESIKALDTAGSTRACAVLYMQFDLSAWSPTTGINSAYIEFDIDSKTGNPSECDLLISSTNTLGSTMFNEGISYGTTQSGPTIANEEWVNCNDAVANNYQVNIVSGAFPTIEAAAGGTITFLGAFDDYTRDGTEDQIVMSDYTLYITYDEPAPLEVGAPDLTDVNDGAHTLTTQLNLEWTASTIDNVNGYRIYMETPVGNGFTTLVSNTTNTTLYYNHTGLTAGTLYNYKVAGLNATDESAPSDAFAYSPHKLPDAVDDLVVTTNSALQFLLNWGQPTLYGTIQGYNINYTTPAGDPQTIYVNHTSSSDLSATISGFSPTAEHSFRVAPVTIHGLNASGNIYNATLVLAVEVGNLNFTQSTNQDVESIWYVLTNVDSTTDDVDVRFDTTLNLDCTITQRIAGTVTNYTSISETVTSDYSYHTFTVTNAGNDILDWDCWDQTDPTINGQYSLNQADSSAGALVGDIPMFSLMGNFTDGLYGTEGDFAGIDLITLLIVIVSMLGFNRKNPALGVGIMTTMLGAAWYYEVIPWTSGVLGGIAMVLVLAIGQGIKKD